MPYIICQNIPGCLPEEDPVAVATHFEARETAAHYVEQITGGDDAYEDVYTDAQNVSELGDVFGPLPGGYIVEVERVHTHRLAALAGVEGYVKVDGTFSVPLDEIIDAYNGVKR